MATARNGDVEIYYERFGAASDPTLLLVNGLGSQCINFAAEWCEMFAAQGFEVVRFDNRDVGLSTKLVDEDYSLKDMAADTLAVLDAVGAEQAHVMGVSMGGMITQRLAIDHPDRMLTMTSVMSTTGERGYGEPSREALEILLGPAAKSRSEYIERHLAGIRVYGSKPEWVDEKALQSLYGEAFDRSFSPKGVARQMAAVLSDGSRADGLLRVGTPTLVLHGSRDRLVDPSGGRRTAELVPRAKYVEIEGMGHDYPAAVWERWVGLWAEFVGA